MAVLCKVEHLCFVLKFSGNNPALRVAPKRYRPAGEILPFDEGELLAHAAL